MSRKKDKSTGSSSRGAGDFKGERNWGSILLWGVVIFIGLLAIKDKLTVGTPYIRYDEFKKMVAGGKVKSVKIGKDEITAVVKQSSASGKAGRTFNVIRIRDSKEDLIGFLERNGVEYEGKKPADSWLPLILWGIMPLVVLLFLWRTMFRRMGTGSPGALSFGRSRAKIRGEKDTQITFDDVAGIDEVKEELKEIIEFLQNPQKFTRIGARIPKGVLLVGPPGTGKTLLARAVAGEARVTFFSISGSEFVEMFVGVGAARVRDLFEQASRHAPCIVFIDELDALGKSRGGGIIAGNDEREQTLNQLLVEMDGFDPKRGVIIMAATNRPEILDVALLRPGRFDRQILVDKPDRRGREEILKVHAKGVKMGADVDLKAVAAKTPGFAGAELANVVNESALLAARRGKERVEQAELDEAVERVVAGLEKKSRIITEQEREIIACHEVGHALVSEFLGGADRVAKISIVPRGISALGYTMQMPTEDRYLMRKSELMVKIAGLLGGRAAEQIVFGEVSTGAQNDLRRSTEIARAMVVDFGMSPEIGPISLSEKQKSPFMAEIGIHPSREYLSDELSRKVDREIERIIKICWEKAYKILEDNRQLLDILARALLEKEYLEENEFKKIIRDHRGADIEKVKINVA